MTLKHSLFTGCIAQFWYRKTIVRKNNELVVVELLIVLEKPEHEPIEVHPWIVTKRPVHVVLNIPPWE